MSALTTIKIIEAKNTISSNDIIQKIEDALKREFDKVKIIENADNTVELHCRVHTKLLNPIVSIKGPIFIQIRENRAKVMIDGDTKTNGWFWFTLVIGSLFPLIWLAMFALYFLQKNSSIESFEKVFERIEFELKDF